MMKDEIYRRWEMLIKRKDVKFKLSKKYKHYIDKPYIAPNTIDETVMDEEEIRILIQKKLDEKIRKHLSITSIIDVPLIFRDNNYVDGLVYVVGIEPLFQPTVIGESEDVYKIDGIKNIKHLRFYNIEIYSAEYRIPEIYTYQTGQQVILSAKHMLPSNYYQSVMKTVINSYYGIKDVYNTNKDNYTQLSVMINNTWKVHAIVFTSKSSVLEMIHSMYEEGIVTFETYANEILTYLDIQKLVENGIIFSNYGYKILNDVLTYDKPSKFRRELFKYLEDQQTIDYYKFTADKLNKPTRFGLSNNFYVSVTHGQYVSYRDDILRFIQQYKIQLLSVMNKYGDIVDNVEDIGL